MSQHNNDFNGMTDNILNQLDLKKEDLERIGAEVYEKENMINCNIDSYIQFDALISLLGCPNGQLDCNWNRFYRGVSNKNYDLICSLSVNNLEGVESEIINDLYSRSPDKFSVCKTDFEMVALMQHYGLPTRLLDFSRNPLVALWFACQQNKEDSFHDSDGAVYVAFSALQAPKRFINSTFKIALSDEWGKMSSLKNLFNTQELFDYVYDYYIFARNMIFLDAPVVDIRERNQQAVFLLGINEIIVSNDNSIEHTVRSFNEWQEALRLILNDESDVRVKLGAIHCYDKENGSNKVLRIVIPSKTKQQILQELSLRGIDESFIYPTLDNYCKQIKKHAIDKDVAQKTNTNTYLYFLQNGEK